MSFGEAVKTCFSKYATFEGRARRSEFWFFYLFVVIVSAVATLIDNLIGWQVYAVSSEGAAIAYNPGWIQLLVTLALFIPMISVSVRRLHDRDASGWWWWLGLICCIGGLILIFAFYVQPGTPGPNKYGPDPKGALL